MEPVLDKIREFADRAHGDQMRKYSSDRYIVHPVRVMQICAEYDPRLPILATALLHDVLEDTPITASELRNFLKTLMTDADVEETLALVIEMTDVYTHDAYPEWNRGKRKELELARIVLTSPQAQTIKYADIMDNSKEIVGHDRGFAPRYLSECLTILKKADKGNKELHQRALAVVQRGLEAINSRRRF